MEMHNNEQPAQLCGFCGELTTTTYTSIPISLAGRKKRKLLNGNACKAEAAVLYQALLRYNLRSSYFECVRKLKEPSTLLCVKCQKLLLKNKALQEELQRIINQIDENIEKLMGLFMIEPSNQSLPAVSLSGRVETPAETSHPSSSCTPARNQRKRSTPSETAGTSAVEDSPDVSVLIKRRNVSKTTRITPGRKNTVISLTTGRYKRAAKNIVALSRTNKYVLSALVNQMRAEMKTICSINCNSVLRSDNKALKNFSWEQLWGEFMQQTPSIVLFFETLLPKSDHKFLAFLISIILKCRCKHMSLVQRVMSVLLYANGTSKQVYGYLHPFKITMSPTTTTDIISAISKDYNSEVLKWADELRERIKHAGSSGSSALSTLSSAVDLPSSDDDSYSTDYSVGSVSFFSQCSGVNDDYSSDDNADSQNQGIPFVDDQCEENITLQSPCEQQAQVFGSEELLDEQTLQPIVSPNQSPTECITLQPSISQSSFGYVNVIDNVDMNIRRSFQRSDRTTKSHHFCHAYAVLNRIDTSTLSDGPPSGALSIEDILPSSNDLFVIIADFIELMKRDLVRFMPEFNGHEVFVDWHKSSDEYKEEMSQKSVVVPLGVQLKNENNLKEMSEILLELNKYVPVQDDPQTINIAGDAVISNPDVKLSPRLLFGDQLTVARARGAAALRIWHKTSLNRLEGHVPVVSDWHTRLCLVTVIHNRMYSGGMSTDKGTLLQLRNLINRTSYGGQPKHNMKASEDFLECVLSAHIITAGKEVMAANKLPVDCNIVAKAIVEHFVKITLPSAADDHEPNATSVSRDSVQAYAMDILSLLLLWKGYHDAIKHGDGTRILIYWKFLGVIFKGEGHRNYAKESFNLLAQSVLLSPRQAAELKWCRTVNTLGCVGRNIPVDLHMEHLNRRLKCMLHHLGSNVTPESVLRASRALGAIESVCCNFNEISDIPLESDHHSRPSYEADFLKVQAQLEKEQVFCHKGNRFHTGFKNHKVLLSSVKWDKYVEWIKEQIMNYNV